MNLAKGSAEPNKNRVGKITLKQVEEIAKIKAPDLNSYDLEGAMNQVKGTARSMGVDVVYRFIYPPGKLLLLSRRLIRPPDHSILSGVGPWRAKRHKRRRCIVRLPRGVETHKHATVDVGHQVWGGRTSITRICVRVFGDQYRQRLNYGFPSGTSQGTRRLQFQQLRLQNCVVDGQPIVRGIQVNIIRRQCAAAMEVYLPLSVYDMRRSRQGWKIEPHFRVLDSSHEVEVYCCVSSHPMFWNRVRESGTRLIPWLMAV